VKPNGIVVGSGSGRTITVESPYNPEFVRTAKDLGGKWNNPVWVFDARTEPRVREALLKIYGTDTTDYRSVTVQINAYNWWQRCKTESLWFAGRKIASRRSRDEAVRLGDGVSIITGRFPSSGGSMKYPSLQLDEALDLVLEIYDVPAGHADLESTLVTVIDDESVAREALIAEREALIARIAEIDALLAEPSKD
jgi:hypothetical protein